MPSPMGVIVVVLLSGCRESEELARSIAENSAQIRTPSAHAGAVE